MKKLQTIIIILIALTVQAQTTASLKSYNAEKPIYLKDWDIDIKVTGNIAVTTQTLVFYNPNNRILEGEFNFPLNENQTVSRFAMDFNGILREGSIVDKEKGRATFEKIIRQKVDPGLLEMTKGNNFRSRVYPVPSLGTKTIVIAYEQELQSDDSSTYYILPINYKDTISSFHIKVTILKSKLQPKWIENDISNFVFNTWQESYIAETALSKFVPSSNISFRIPLENKEQTYIQKINNETFFYTYQNFKGLITEKKKPSSIVVLWDVSMSKNNSTLIKEISFLTNYLNSIKNTTVRLVTFSSHIHSDVIFKIDNGNIDSLINTIAKLNYDGGTQLGILDLTKYNHVDEILLFTDGISNFGKQEISSSSQKPLYVINATPVANHDYLNTLAQKNKGAYLNLLMLSMQDALDVLSTEFSKVIDIKVESGSVAELYPIIPFTIYKNINFSGILKSENAILKIRLSHNGKIEEKQIYISKKDINNETVQRVWANKKLSYLMSNPDKNQQAIKEIGLKYSIVTPYTSLIVLDNIDDYVRYEIIPPAEMQKEYWNKMELKKKQNAEVKKEVNEYLKEQLDIAYEEMEDRIDWWKTDFTYNQNKKDSTKSKTPVNTTGTNTYSTSTNTTTVTTHASTSNSIKTTQQLTPIQFDSLTMRKISGTVKDKNSETLIGVNVTGKGTTIGAVTDIDGNYTIILPKEITTLVFSYIGYTNVEKPILSNRIDVVLAVDAATMDEVVVTAMSIRRELRTETFSVSKVTAESISSMSSNTLSGLIGKTPGVQINSTSNSSDISNRIILSGESSFSENNGALIVVDGIPVLNNNYTNNYVDFGNRGNEIDPEDISSITILKNKEATSLYGSRAANGVIIINTNDNNSVINNTTPEIQTETVVNNEKDMPLYLLNDSIIPFSEVKLIDFDSITSIQTLPEKDAIIKYGNIAKYGAVLFSTKIDTLKVSKILDTEKKLLKFMENFTKVPKDQQYNAYLDIKKYNINNFSFYMDVASYFYETNRKEIGIRILSNIAELELENHKLMRAMAYVLESWKEIDYALKAYEEIIKIKGEEPQSHRDYALALAQSGNYQKALDILFSILTKKWEDSEERFEGIEGIVINEMNQIIKMSKKPLNTTAIPKKFLKELPVGFRVLIDWNKDETDIDLHIIEPTKEECYYSNEETEIGGRISNDFTDGYGPEEYLLKKKFKGTYKISIDYYGDEVQEIRTPAVVKATIFKNYNSTSTTIETYIKRLESNEEDDEDKNAVIANVKL